MSERESEEAENAAVNDGNPERAMKAKRGKAVERSIACVGGR
jgi:hypothetical protein